jgi:hypothetical protein
LGYRRTSAVRPARYEKVGTSGNTPALVSSHGLLMHHLQYTKTCAVTLVQY